RGLGDGQNDLDWFRFAVHDFDGALYRREPIGFDLDGVFTWEYRSREITLGVGEHRSLGYIFYRHARANYGRVVRIDDAQPKLTDGGTLRLTSYGIRQEADQETHFDCEMCRFPRGFHCSCDYDNHFHN